MNPFRFLLRGRHERELEEEIRSHLAMAVRDRIDRGEDPAEAERAARREFGNRVLVEETTRQMWGWTWLERLLQDLRYAARGMRRSPAFTAAAVFSLALGIGANTAIFSLIDALLLRWLPVRDPATLYQVRTAGPFPVLSYPAVRLLDEQGGIFSSVGGYASWSFAVGPAGAVRNVRGALVTGRFYEALGIAPLAGRLLMPEDDREGAPPVAVITEAYWAREFDRDPGAVGRSVRINGASVPIVGVTPRGFTGATVGVAADITVAAAALRTLQPDASGLLGPGNSWLTAVARLQPSESVEEAGAKLAALWPSIAERVISPSWPLDRKKGVLESKFAIAPGGTGSTYLRILFEKPLLILMGMVTVVLMIACANVANLLLARSAARQREIAVRLAIGAGRRRIIRQMLTESGLLALLGGALGVALSYISGSLLVGTVSNSRMPVDLDLTPNGHVLGYTLAVSLGTALLFGIAPALQFTKRGPMPALKDGGRKVSRLLPVLVVAQVAFSLLLLIGAGLFVRTLQNLERIDPGFRHEGVLLLELPDRRDTGDRELIDGIRRVPGVLSASISTHTPLSGSTWSEPVAVAGQPLPARDNAVFVGAAPGFFETMRIPLLAGRGFVESDGKGASRVAVINEELARRLFAGRHPVGARLSAVVRGERIEMEIVGVARNTMLGGLRKSPPPVVYVSYFQLSGDVPGTLEVRAAGALTAVAAEIRKSVQSQLPESAVEVRTFSSQVARGLAQERLLAILASGFGSIALLLACAGLYSLLNYSVIRRTREIGLRMALGAQRRRVIAGEVKSAFALVGVGIVFGLPAAWVSSRWIESMLFGLAPADPATTIGAACLLAVAALAAAYVPARRASKLDPMATLRHE